MIEFDVTKTITDIQRAQRLNNQAIAALRPDGAFGRAVQIVTAKLHRFMVSITHVDTGALKGSEWMEINMPRLSGRIFINPSFRNPRSGQRPADYGPIENARGGEHAFFDRTLNEAQTVLGEGVRVIQRGIGW